MADSDLLINLFYDLHENSFKIKTNLKEDRIDEVLSECYRATLSQEPDHREFNKREIYNIKISLDLSQDEFLVCSDTGNRVLTYELIRESINNWKLLPEEASAEKGDLEKIIIKNVN